MSDSECANTFFQAISLKVFANFLTSGTVGSKLCPNPVSFLREAYWRAIHILCLRYSSLCEIECLNSNWGPLESTKWQICILADAVPLHEDS